MSKSRRLGPTTVDVTCPPRAVGGKPLQVGLCANSRRCPYQRAERRRMEAAAVYLRQSIDRYGAELAIGPQPQACLNIGESRGGTPHEYANNDRPAATGRRPANDKMLEVIRTERINAVVVW